MKIPSRIRGWLQRARQSRAPDKSRGPLREFIYLDDVSVYSILASRKGGIATEFTESQTASLNSEVEGTIGVGLGATRAKLDSKIQTGHVQASQVLRKAVIQTSFKELYDIERESLAMRPPDANQVPEDIKLADFEGKLDSLIEGGWVVDPSTLHRGELLEVDVELEADPLFHLASIIATLRELMEDNESLLGVDFASRLPEMSSMAHVLESLLVGLVPIRGRLVDYKSARIGTREVLIHRSMVDRVAADAGIKACPAFVVGVAQRNLFWKDIRRLLFSEARYTVFARLAKNGITDKWHPIGIAAVLGGIAPQFDELMTKFSESARLAMTSAPNSTTAASGQDARTETDVIRRFATLLLGHHNSPLTQDLIEELSCNIPREQDWLKSVDGRRSVLGEVTRRVEEKLNVEIPGEVACKLRNKAMTKAGLSASPFPRELGGNDNETANHPLSEERFLDAEIVAIYW